MRTSRWPLTLTRISAPLAVSLTLSLPLAMLGPGQPGIAEAATSGAPRSAVTADEPSATVNGVVRDGSGQGWPLYAKIIVSGVQNAAAYTDPTTGRYSLSLPQGQTHTLHVVALYTGYLTKDQPVAISLGISAVTANVSLEIDEPACDAPGYTAHRTGTTQTFETGSVPEGWSVTGTERGWIFPDPALGDNHTGGSGGFAVAPGGNPNRIAKEDTALNAPPADLSGARSPAVGFDTSYGGTSSQAADVEVSADGGATWTTLWHQRTQNLWEGARIDLLLPAGYAVAGVLVRFHLTRTTVFGGEWQVDNVFIGNRTCDPVPGGLVIGQTTDANTHAPLAGAAVTAGTGDTATHTASAPTPDDPALGDGFYWTFARGIDPSPISATLVLYRTVSTTVAVVVGSTVRMDLALPAGRISVNQVRLDTTVSPGGRAEAQFKITNEGTASASVTLNERGGEPAPAPDPVNAATTSWNERIRNYPTSIRGHVAAAHKGKIYAGFGYSYSFLLPYDHSITRFKSLYIYDPATNKWNEGASGLGYREQSVAAFIGDRLYVAGGVTSHGSSLDVYDSVSNVWTTGAPMPTAYENSGVAALGGKMYVIGGCTGETCSDQVQVYDSASNSWSLAAPYPELVSAQSCGTIAGKIYCAGGANDTAASVHTWAYDPDANVWTARADMPVDLYSSVHTAAQGLLLIAGGITDHRTKLTNRAVAYDPSTDSWAALRPAKFGAVSDAASACGIYRIGGAWSLVDWSMETSAVELLPGFSECEEAYDLPWLSTSVGNVTLQPGQSVTVTVTLDAGVGAPGYFSANLAVIANTPYQGRSLPVTMTVQQPGPSHGPTNTKT